MKKVRGKALALVLSIALVVSSFSAIPASAARRSETAADVDGEITDQYLVNGAKDSVSYSTEVTLTSVEHDNTISADLTAISRVSGPDLVKWDIDDDDDTVTLRLRGTKVEGTETLKALYKGSVTDDDDNVTTYTCVKEFNVTVFEENSVVIADATKAPQDNTGKDVRFTKTFAQKTTDDTVKDSAVLAVYQAKRIPGDAKVVWEDVTTSGNYTFEVKAGDLDQQGTKFSVKDGAHVGNVTIKATTDDADLPDEVTAKSKITKTLLVNEPQYLHFVRNSSTTYLSANTEYDEDDTLFPVNGYEVKFDNAAGAVTVEERAAVDTISGTVASLEVDGGSVKTIDLAAGNVTVTGEKSKTGDISTDAAVKDSGTVTVDTGATTGAIDAVAVEVTDAKTGDITADEEVAVSAEEEDTATSTGNITAGGNVTLSTGDETAKLSVGTLKANGDNLTFDISGNTTIGGIDFNYYDTTLSFSDFQGKVPAPQKVLEGKGTIETTSTDDSVVEVTGDATLGTVTAEDETTIAFDSKITVSELEGPGSIVIKAGNLTVLDGIYDAVLKLSDEPITSGLKVFKASAGAVDVDNFTPYGYTLKLAEGNDYDTFSVDALQFVGLKINGNARIVKDTNATFTASAYPTGSAIPADYTVEWSVDNTDKFTATPNADGSVTVAAANFDEDFASENKGVLTATLVDKDGYEYDEDYEPGTLDLTEIAVPDTTYKSDTTGTVKLDLGKTYQFKITSLDGKIPSLKVANNGATVAPYTTSGNDYFYKVTGANVGNYGVYVNADKTPVAVLNITSNVKIDTTTVTIASGKTYQFKVTAPAQPTFQVAGLGTIALAQKTGNDYFYKVTANNVKGGHGVYVNGARLAIATFA